jgi:uncharacterized delta-60 repeat protein
MMSLPTARRSRLRCEALEDRLTPANAGDLDTTFNGTGINTAALGSNVAITADAIAPDGKIIAAGIIRATTGTGGSGVFASGGGTGVLVARFLPSGQLDPSFHGNGQVVIDHPTIIGSVSGVAVQLDGAILVDVVEHNPDLTTGEMDRVSADGNTVETNKASGGVSGIVVNPTTGDVYLADTANAGYVPADAPRPDVYVTRLDRNLNPLGSAQVDLSGGQDDGTVGIALDPSGRVYVVSAEPNNQFGLTRFDADLNQASVRTMISDGVPSSVSGIAINSSGQVFVAGLTSQGGAISTVVWRFDAELKEQVQRALNFIGSNASRSQHSIATDPAGRVILVRNALPLQSGNTDFAVARLNPSDLSPDTTFNTTGVKTLDIGTGDVPSDVAVDRVGNIVVVGTTESQNATSGTSVIFRLLGLDNMPTGPVLVGGSPDGSATPLTATGGSYQPGTAIPFFPGSAGNVRAAVADVNGDGVPDYVGGSGAGGGPRVAVLDGKTGARLADFFAFEASFTGGVFVAAADLNGDGRADLVITPDQGGGPVVAIYDGAKLSAGQTAHASQLTRFLGIDDPAFRGGARAALGDVSGDGTPDLLVSAGFLGGPRVALYDGTTINSSTPVKLVPDFFAFEDSLRNGAFVTAGDLTGDGQEDMLFGAGPGGAPRVRAFDAAKLLAAGSFGNLDAIASSAQVANFFAGDTASRGGVRLAVRNADGDGKADLITGSGEGEPASVAVYKSSALLASATPSADQTLDPFGGATLADGVFVG